MDASPRILIVDDERAIADLVAETLLREGMDPVACYSGQQALDLFSRSRFDLAILDIMMPGIGGLEVCTRLRAVSDLPIILLSAKDEEADKVIGLTIGGDDYVEKPFKHRELVARVRACLRRSSSSRRQSPTAIEARGIEVDPVAHTAALHGEPLSLTPKEFAILSLLVEEAGAPVSAQDIYERVWGEPFAYASANSVMVHIRNLRRKLADIDGSETFIETAWGVGYRIAPDRT